MFEKSIAALRTAFPDQRVTVAFIGGTIEERNAFGKRKLINFQDVERLNIEAGEDLAHKIRGRTLAGAVLFGLDPSVADSMRSIQNAVSTAANLLGCSTQDLIHDEYVAQPQKTKPPLAGFFRHTDGGMYEVLMTANSSTDVSPVVVYKHWWPFLPSVWTRPLSEWHDRFTPITLEEYGDAVFAMNVEQGRELVSARRKARKAIEKAEALASASRPSVEQYLASR